MTETRSDPSPADVELPPEVLALLDASLGTFEKVELAWRLWSAGAPVPLAELQVALRYDDQTTREVIEELLAARIVAVDGATGAVRLGPRAQHGDFQALMALYAEDRLAVVSALSSIAMHRIRTLAARTFSDAFILKQRRRRDGGG